MKSLKISLLLIFASSSVFKSQVLETMGSKANFIKEQGYLMASPLKSTKHVSDSLQGFNENTIKASLISRNLTMSEYVSHIAFLKREFINTKYHLIKSISQNSTAVNPPSKIISPNNFVNVIPCINEDFELTPVGTYTTGNAVAGWSVSSQVKNGCAGNTWTSGSMEFSVVSTPVFNFPSVGTIGPSPFGGSKVVRLNDQIPSTISTKITTSFPVTSSNSLFQFAYAGYYQNAGHLCCDDPGLSFRVLGCNNQLLTCSSLDLTPSCAVANSATYTGNSSGFWTNWQVNVIDLSPYIGSCVTIEFINSDCSFGGHYGTTLLDAQCGSPLVNSNLNPITTNTLNYNTVSYCAGSSTAIINGLSGYNTYTWVPPAAAGSISSAQASLSSLTVLNPTPGLTYTLNFTTAWGCGFTTTYTLVPSQVSLIGQGSSLSCSLGSAGSASIQPYGSSVGYAYAWVNSTNSVISTASVATGLSPGNYTVTVSAPNFSSCGTASTVVTVSAGINAPTNIPKPYCNGVAYLNAPSGSNYKWYFNNAPLSAPTGTAQNYTVTAPANGLIYQVGYTNQGCRDSVIYTLYPSAPNPIFVATSSPGCPGSLGAATINLLTTNFPLSGSNSFSVFSTGTISPAYSSSLSNSSLPSFSLNNIPSNGNFSVSVFDGSCYSGTVFSVNSLVPPFDYSLSPNNATVCVSSSFNPFVNFNSAPSNNQYFYLWASNSFIISNPNIISPTLSFASYPSGIYTLSLTVTPTLANCPITKTLVVNILNPVIPQIFSIPSLCNTSGPYTTSFSPIGGTFYGNGPFSAPPVNALTGVITPSLASIGTNTISYVIGTPTCFAQQTKHYIVNPSPTIAISGNLTICAGSTATISASGANTYSWSNNMSGSSILVSPNQTSVYSVTATNTLGNCSANSLVTVSINPVPILTIYGNTLFCIGNLENTLTVSGANAYSWSNGSNLSSVSFSPSISTYYSVVGTDTLTGCYSTSSILVTVDACLSLKTTTGTTKLSVYPNPSNGLLTINSFVQSDITIYNQIGQLLLQKKVSAGISELNISQFSDGIYYLQAKFEDELNVIKLIKN
jgi:hypothetical protein